MRALACLLALGACATTEARVGLPTAEERAGALRVLQEEFARAELPSPVAVARVLWIDAPLVALDEHTLQPVCGLVEVTLTSEAPPDCLVLVAAGGRLPHESTLAHELAHCMLALRDGDPDKEHAGDVWRTWVPTANRVLRESGL